MLLTPRAQARVLARIALCALITAPTFADLDSLFRHRDDVSTRWSTPENPNGQPSAGARENGGAKGRAFVSLPAGHTHTLLETTGSGRVTRLWLTVMDRSPAMLRALRLEMFWDGESTPAVAVPLGDFFGANLGRTAPFHSALLANPEGRSFVCEIPMPFRKGAKIQITNDGAKDLSHLFYDVDFLTDSGWENSTLYFHAVWRRENPTALGRDFEILPNVRGKGRYLGTTIGVQADPRYGDTWWGEGEVKIFLDDDLTLPTLAGTGTEDYIGTGWGQGTYAGPHAGCLIADEAKKQWTFYRFHVPDPIFFQTGCRVTLQQIGGGMRDQVARLQRAGAPLIPVTLDANGKLRHLYEPRETRPLDEANLPDGWVNFYRSDDVSAVAYFYLDAPVNGVAPLAAWRIRTADLRE